jgi:hypothetical protein
MKKPFIFKILLLPISLLAACGNHHKTIDFIPGTYVNQAQSAYSIANDTLVIAKDAATGNIYHVTRKTGFRRIVNWKLLPAAHQVKTLTGLLDEQKQILQITQNGILLLFQPEQNKLTIQNSEYKKL